MAGAVVVPARSPAKARAAVAGLPGVELETLELGEPDSIDAFAGRFLASGRPLSPYQSFAADFNADGHPDIVLITSRPGGQVVQVIDYFHNTFIMPPTPTPNGYGGPPTVADLDGDGRPEFTTAGSASYYVYSPDCLSTPRPAKCHGADPGVLWQSPTQDISSGSTGSSPSSAMAVWPRSSSPWSEVPRASTSWS